MSSTNGIVHVYTIKNWLLVKYLWPNGDWVNGQYCVYLDVDSPDFDSKLTKLGRHSATMHQAISDCRASGVAIFAIHCARG